MVNWQHPEDSSKEFKAVVGVDFGIFSMVQSFIHKDVTHSLLFAHSHIDTQGVRVSNVLQKPELPEVSQGEFTIISGDPQDAAGIAPLVKLMDLFAAQGDQLIAAYAARLEYLRDAEEWKRRQPPPKPMDRTFWLRPHRGSRYLQSDTEGGAR